VAGSPRIERFYGHLLFRRNKIMAKFKATLPVTSSEGTGDGTTETLALVGYTVGSVNYPPGNVNVSVSYPATISASANSEGVVSAPAIITITVSDSNRTVSAGDGVGLNYVSLGGYFIGVTYSGHLSAPICADPLCTCTPPPGCPCHSGGSGGGAGSGGSGGSGTGSGTGSGDGHGHLQGPGIVSPIGNMSVS